LTIEIVSRGDGAALTLTHIMDPKWADYTAQTRGGWTMILAGLARTLGESE